MFLTLNANIFFPFLSSRIKNYYLNAETKYCCSNACPEHILFHRFDSPPKKGTNEGKRAFEMFVYNHFLRQMWE